MFISGRTQPLFPRYSILQALQVIKSLGFAGVEICLETDELNPGILSPGLSSAIHEAVDRLGLEPSVTGYHKDYIYDDTEFALSQAAIRLAPALGTKVLIFSGTTRRRGDVEEWTRMINRTRRLVEIAEDQGVVLAQEFEPGFIVGSTHDVLRLFEEIPSQNLAANLDLGHVFLCDPNPLDSIRLLGTKIVHCHIENMASGIHNHLLPQEGDMDLLAFLQALSAADFQGALALDLYAYDYQAVAPEALIFLNGLMAELNGRKIHKI